MEKEGSIKFCWQWSKPYLSRYKFRFIFLCLIAFVAVALNLFQVNFVQRSIDAVLVRDTGALLKTLFLFILITALRIIQGYLYGFYSKSTFLNLNRDLNNKCVNQLLKAKSSNIAKESKGDLYTRIDSDISGSLGFIQESYSNLFLQPVMSIGGLIYLFYYNWKLSILTFILLPVLAVLINVMSQKSGHLYNKVQQAKSSFTEISDDTINGYEVIKSYNMQPYKLGKIKEVLNLLFKEENSFAKNEAITIALILSVTYVPTIISLLFGGYLVSKGEITVSLLFAYSQLIPTICSPTISLFSSIRTIRNSYYSMKRVDKILNLESEREDGSDFEVKSNSIVKFENVTFAYNDNKAVINGLDLEVNKGECIGIIGNNGAGKSTLIQLICGLYEVHNGFFSMFGCNVNSWNLERLRQHISYMSQKVNILSDTIYENIRYGNLQATEEEIHNAAKMAGLQEFIDSLKDGYSTMLNEDGENLSGGQKQRISIVRAFLKHADLYIFDEPTASLDSKMEAKIMDEIMNLIKTKHVTSIIVSHNLNNLRKCDTVYYIQDGKVLESGTMNELLARKGELYKKFSVMNEVNKL